MSDAILRTIVSLSIQGTVAGLLVMALRRVLGRRLSIRVRCFLWAVVLCKLLVPINISSAVSVFNLFNRFQPIAGIVNNTTGLRLARVTETTPYQWTAAPNAPSGNDLAANPLAHPAVSGGTAGETFAVDAPTDTLKPTRSPFGPAGMNASAFMLSVMALIGMALCLRAAWRYMQLKIRVYKWRRESVGSEQSEHIRDYLAAAGITDRHNVDVVCTDAARTPYTFGFAHPIIVLPGCMGEQRVGETAFRAVIYHEATHIKLQHHRVKCITMLLPCIFWFNPFVYLFNRALAADLEAACDDRVITLMNKADYAHALAYIASIRHPSRFAPLVAFTENGLKHRVKRILEDNTMTKLTQSFMALSAVLAALLCVTLLTGAKPGIVSAAADTATYATTEAYTAPNTPNLTTTADDILKTADTALHRDPYWNTYWESDWTMDLSTSFTETPWETLRTEAIDIETVADVALNISSTSVRLAKTKNNTAYAVLVCEKYAEWFSLTAVTTATPESSGRRFTVTAGYHTPLTTGDVSTPRSVLIVYLPDHEYDTLQVSAKAASAQLADVQAKRILLDGSASAFSLTESDIGTITLQLAASALKLADNHFAALTGHLSASGLSAVFDTSDFDMDMTAQASTLNLTFGQPVTNALISLRSAIGTLTCPDTWKAAPDAAWTSEYATHRLDVTLGTGSHTWMIDATASTLSVTDTN